MRIADRTFNLMYMRPGISFYIVQRSTSDLTSAEWRKKNTSAISISLRPNAARETSVSSLLTRVQASRKDHNAPATLKTIVDDWKMDSKSDDFFFSLVLFVTSHGDNVINSLHGFVFGSRLSRQCHYPSRQSTDLNVPLRRFCSTPVNRTILEVIVVFQYPVFSWCEPNCCIRLCLNLDIHSQMPRPTGYWNHKTSGHWYSHRRGESTFKPQVRQKFETSTHLSFLTGQWKP